MTGQSEAQRDENSSGPWTIRRVLAWTQKRFSERGIPSPRLDAELLLSHCVGRPRIALYTHFDQPLDPIELERFRGLIRRRMAGEPVAYLIGQKEFYGLSLKVSAAVLIPRPETELLVDLALRELSRLCPPAARVRVEPEDEATTAAPAAEPVEAEQSAAVPGVELTVHYDPPAVATPETETETETETEGQVDADAVAAAPTNATHATPPATVQTASAATVPAALAATVPAASAATVVDVGTGSGAVALAIKHERAELRMVAIDRCPEALAVATDNAQKLGLAVEFLPGDLLQPLPAEVRPDVVVANLPYIPTAEIAGLAPEVRSEPHTALDGGRDGLDLIRRLITQAAERLRPEGALLLELGAGQAAAVESLLRAAGFTATERHADLAGIERVVLGRRPATG